jgi:hypothetical protein
MFNETNSDYNIVEHAIFPVIAVSVAVCSCVGIYCYKEKNRNLEQEIREEQQNFFENIVFTDV